MRLDWIIFGLLVAMCLALVAAMLTPEPTVVSGEESLAAAHGLEHKQFATMRQGGDGAERLRPVLWYATAFGLLQMGLFVCLLAVGLGRGERRDGRWWALTLGGVLYMLTFIWLVVSYWHYATQSQPGIPFFFPAPTAVMIFGLWIVPMIFLALYVWRFDRWVLTPEDLARYERLLQEARDRAGGA